MLISPWDWAYCSSMAFGVWMELLSSVVPSPTDRRSYNAVILLLVLFVLLMVKNLLLDFCRGRQSDEFRIRLHPSTVRNFR